MQDGGSGLSCILVGERDNHLDCRDDRKIMETITAMVYFFLDKHDMLFSMFLNAFGNVLFYFRELSSHQWPPTPILTK
jgi:hypothetical protein